ncbi:hypothetical protein B566_EDAN005929 [Ephemera danica]|nr:hypothetical protein B566_EDAN005929 [Ephemera danica]
MTLGVDNTAYTDDAEVPGTNSEPQQKVFKEQVTEEQTCGWWRLRPRSLQGFRTAKWALFWLCWAGALQGMVVNGFVNVVITTIERRFGMRSRETGFVAGGYDIASFLCLVPVSYLGGRPGASKPRWLGWGVLLMGLGSLVFAVPHFVAGPLRDAQRDHLAMCTHSANFSSSHEEEMCGTRTVTQPLQGRAVWFFLAAQLLHGAGAAPLFTLGVTYIDENVSKKMSSVYLGVYYTMAILGPAVGFVMGGQLLRLYTDVLLVDPAQLGLTPESNVWVGAWWIGFLISAVLCVLVAVPLLAFPASLPGASELQAQRVSEAHHVARKDEGGTLEQDSAASKLRELPRALRRLLANPTFFFLNLAGATEGLLIAGFAAFLPKLIESQFAVNATLAALLMGAVTVPAGGGGTFLGGYLVKRLNLSCAGIIKFCALTALVANVFTLGFFLSCPNVPFAGVTVPYTNSSTSFNLSTTSLSSACNENCVCSEHNFDPVCGADRIMYYSPCFAGCSQEARRGDAKVYSQCTCISAANATLASDESMEATNQMCPSSCKFLWPFIALVFSTMVFTFLGTMPALSATLRCVEDNQRSFALGIQWIKVRVVGTIPAPIIFGTLIDESCILWQQPDECSSSEEHGACRLYDNFRMSWYMALLAFGVKLCSVVFYSLALWLYTPPPPPAESQTTPRPDSCTDISLVQSPSTDTSLGNGHIGSRTTQLELY